MQLRSLRSHPVFRDLGFFSQQNRFACSARETTRRHVLWLSTDQGAKLRRTRKPEQKSLGSVLPLMHDLTGGTAGENQGAFYRVEGTD